MRIYNNIRKILKWIQKHRDQLPVPILGFWGPYAKLCRGGVVEEWMKRICPCFTPSRIALAEGARETVSLRGTLSTRFFFLFQTRDCMTFMLQHFYIESVAAHRIKRNDHSCFHNSWPNSKSKLKLKHLWVQGGPLVFRGPYAACVFCV